MAPGAKATVAAGKVTPGHDSPGFGRWRPGPWTSPAPPSCFFFARPAAAPSAIKNGWTIPTIGPLWGHRYLASVSPLMSATCQLVCSTLVKFPVVALTDRPPMPWRRLNRPLPARLLCLSWRRRFAGSFAEDPRASCASRDHPVRGCVLMAVVALGTLDFPLANSSARRPGLRPVNTPRSSCHRASSESIESHLFLPDAARKPEPAPRPAKARRHATSLHE